ncbi:hypothetical protein CEXT_732831 [Caerostris extrusa]|uniref:Uncharacterized protein n=1 Tax=Caerostris extrusa TaxID=172846 RepID=A0AAV4R1I7_CAEEX|nr:hypothetical protein CEXT_732831 [Caerostris extrusa]
MDNNCVSCMTFSEPLMQPNNNAFFYLLTAMPTILKDKNQRPSEASVVCEQKTDRMKIDYFLLDYVLPAEEREIPGRLRASDRRRRSPGMSAGHPSPTLSAEFEKCDRTKSPGGRTKAHLSSRKKDSTRIGFSSEKHDRRMFPANFSSRIPSVKYKINKRQRKNRAPTSSRSDNEMPEMERKHLRWAKNARLRRREFV